MSEMGPEAPFWKSADDFGFAPISRHFQSPSACLKGANFGIGSVVTARKEVERGPPPRGQPRPDQRPVPGGTNCPEGRSYQAFTQDLNQTLICAFPQ